MEKVFENLSRNEERILAELFDFLRIPSISTDPEYSDEVKRGAGWLADKLAGCGFTAKVEPTGGHPAVVAEHRKAPGKPTLLVYGHYDVQPPGDEELWRSAPFDPIVQDGKIVCRGVSDDKGQLYCHVAGARALIEELGKLPVNVICLFEGEEESGSDNLEKFIKDNIERFACDGVVISDTGRFAEEVPAITYGLRGLAYLEVTVSGPNRELHSGTYGGAADNPANVLAKLIGELKDDGGRVVVEGFYDRVRELQEWERKMFASLPFDENAFAKDLGVEKLSGEAGFTTLERLWARPTLDVNGMWSGYTGEGAKTVIPPSASAKLSCRLVPDQDPGEIARMLKNHFEAKCPDGCKVSVKTLHGARPVLLPTDNALMEASREAVCQVYGFEPVLIREGGSIPVTQIFHEILGAPVVLLGFGRSDDRAHSPDERLHLDDFRKGMRASALLMSKLGEV